MAAGTAFCWLRVLRCAAFDCYKSAIVKDGAGNPQRVSSFPASARKDIGRYSIDTFHSLPFDSIPLKLRRCLAIEGGQLHALY